MDRAGRGDINKSVYDTLSPEQKAAALRQVGQAPQNNNAQTGDQRAAGFQKEIDSGRITRSQAANNQASGSYFREPNKQTTPTNGVPPPPNLQNKTTTTQPTTQPTPQPLGSPTDTARPVNINSDSAVNFGATQSATPGQANFVAGTKLGDNTTVNARLGTDNTKQVDKKVIVYLIIFCLRWDNLVGYHLIHAPGGLSQSSIALLSSRKLAISLR